MYKLIQNNQNEIMQSLIEENFNSMWSIYLSRIRINISYCETIP